MNTHDHPAEQQESAKVKFVNSVNLSDEDCKYFRLNGFLKIKKLFTKPATDLLRRVASKEVVSAGAIGQPMEMGLID